MTWMRTNFMALFACMVWSFLPMQDVSVHQFPQKNAPLESLSKDAFIHQLSEANYATKNALDAEEPEWYKKLVAKSVTAFQKLERDNKKRIREGMGHLNQYVVSLDDILLDPGLGTDTHIGERGDYATNKLLNHDELEELNKKLHDFHVMYNPFVKEGDKNKLVPGEQKVNLYVLLINDLPVAVKSILENEIQYVSDYKDKIKEWETGEIQKIVDRFDNLPGQVLASLNGTSACQKHIYTYARFNLIHNKDIRAAQTDKPSHYRVSSSFASANDQLADILRRGVPGIVETCKASKTNYARLEYVIEKIIKQYGLCWLLADADNNPRLKGLRKREQLYAANLISSFKDETKVSGYDEFKKGGFRYNFNAAYNFEENNVQTQQCGGLAMHLDNNNTVFGTVFAPENCPIPTASQTKNKLAENYLRGLKFEYQNPTSGFIVELNKQISGHIQQCLELEKQFYVLRDNGYVEHMNNLKTHRTTFVNNTFSLFGALIEADERLCLAIWDYCKEEDKRALNEMGLGSINIVLKPIEEEISRRLAGLNDAKRLVALEALFVFQEKIDQVCAAAGIDTDLEEFLLRKPVYPIQTNLAPAKPNLVYMMLHEGLDYFLEEGGEMANIQGTLAWDETFWNQARYQTTTVKNDIENGGLNMLKYWQANPTLLLVWLVRIYKYLLMER